MHFKIYKDMDETSMPHKEGNTAGESLTKTFLAFGHYSVIQYGHQVLTNMSPVTTPSKRTKHMQTFLLSI